MQDLRVEMTVTKAAPELGIAFGYAVVSTLNGEPYFDLHGHNIDDVEVLKAFDEIITAGVEGDAMHDGKPVGKVTAFPLTAEIAKALEMPPLPKYGLLTAFKATDPTILKALEAGEFSGFSIECKAIVDAVKRASLIKKAASERADLKAKLRALSIKRISLVDVPAQEPALVAIVKAAPRREPTSSKKRAVLTSVTDGHQHLLSIEDGYPSGSTSWSSAGDDAPGHAHDWVRHEDGSIEMAMSNGHTHTFETSAAKAEPTAPAPEKPAMDEKDTLIEQLKARVAELEAKLAETEKTAELPVEEQKFARRLGDAERKAFLAKSATERADIVKPIHKAADGTEYFRGEEKTVELLKRVDAAEDKALTVELTKRATDKNDLGSLAGATVEQKVAVLKAMTKLPDEVRAPLEALLKSGNAAGVVLGSELGTSQGADLETGTDPKAIAKTKLEEFAKSIGKTPEAATAEWLKTAEGAAIYKSMSAVAPQPSR